MLPDPIIVFVNAQRVDVPRGSTALDAVRAWDAHAAEQVTSGARQVADARGLPIDANTPTYSGAIYRVIGGQRGIAEAAPQAEA